MALHDISQLAGAPPLLWSNVKEAFDKINQNFTTIAASGGSGELVNFTGLETDVSPLTAGDFKLGSPTKSWKQLYISEYLDSPGSSGNGVWIGTSQIKGRNGTIDLPVNSTVNGSLIIDPARVGFRTIEVTGQSSVVANDLSTSLKFQTTPGIYITTDPISDIITFQNTGVVAIQGTAGEVGVSGTNNLLTLTNLGVKSVAAGPAVSGRTLGAGISVSGNKGDVTITNTGVLSVQAGIGITISTDTATGIVTVSNSAPASAAAAFSNFAVTGQETINAEIIGDTVTFGTGYGILLTTDPVTDTITFGVDQNIDIIGSIFADDSTTLVDAVNGKIVGPIYTSTLRTSEIDVKIGGESGTNWGASSFNVAVGYQAGYSQDGSQTGVETTAVGSFAGWDQKDKATAIGSNAGTDAQGEEAVAVGFNAGGYRQQDLATAVGGGAGYGDQATKAVAVGHQAGHLSQGANAVALGSFAGHTSQPANSIVINASGVVLNGAEAGFYVNPIRSVVGTQVLYYDTTTKEITYGAAPEGGSIGNITFTGTTIDSVDSSSIAFTPLVTFNSDVVVENELTVAGAIRAKEFITDSVGVPEVSSVTNLNLTAGNAVVITQSPFRLAKFTTEQRDLLTGQLGDMIFNTTTATFQGYNGTTWVDLG